jgi:glycosyltransferase involved in cell wall biosynthesis
MTQDVSVVQVSPAQLTGREHVVLRLARELTALGARSTVLCLEDGPLIEELGRLGISFDILPIRWRYDARGILNISRYLARKRFDVVHTHGARAMFMGNFAARLAGVPAVVTTMHELSYVKMVSGRLYRLHYRAEGWLSRLCADACIANSDRMAQDMIRARKVPRAKIRRIYHGVDIAQFNRLDDPGPIAELKAGWGIAPDEMVVGAVGQLIPLKGHRFLIEALPRIKRHSHRVRLVIAGAGPLRADLEALAAREGVSDNLTLLGYVREIHRLYPCFDVMVYPSIWGVFGLATLEAMACGIPVIASALDGTTELIAHGQTGILAPPGDSAALANAVVDLLLDRDRRARIAEAGRRHVAAHFSVQAFARQHLDLYRWLLDRRKRSSRQTSQTRGELSP